MMLISVVNVLLVPIVGLLYQELGLIVLTAVAALVAARQ